MLSSWLNCGMSKSKLVLGIESSCDDTSIALVRVSTENRRVEGHVVADNTFSQVIHEEYGGVVPELASRGHLAAVTQVLASLGINCSEIEAIAVTTAPGLIGSLMVGVSFAYGLSQRYRLPLLGVHHLEGHLYSPLLERQEIMEFPYAGMIVSGGHTSIYKVHDLGYVETIASTSDDAAGECLDKVGVYMGLPYPAGKTVSEAACKAEALILNGSFDPSQYRLPRVKKLSFSGVKTAFINLYDQLIANLNSASDSCKNNKTFHKFNQESREFAQNEALIHSREDICNIVCYLLLETVTDLLIQYLEPYLDGVNGVLLGGGVVANQQLREKLAVLGQQYGIQILMPEKKYSTDNGAMIAFAGGLRLLNGLDGDLRVMSRREI